MKDKENKCQECACFHCVCNYGLGRKYHKTLMRILWKMSRYILRKLSIPDIHDLEKTIVELENIYEDY